MNKNIIYIKEKYTIIKNQGKRVITNYYNQFENEMFEVFEGEHSIVFTFFDYCVRRVYFYSNDMDELAVLLRGLEGDYVLDFLTKEREALSDLFISSGFQLYAEYERFGEHIRNIDPEEQARLLKMYEKSGLYDEKYGELAKVEDAEVINRRLKEIFDPYESHFYSDDVLREMISNEWVWVAREDGKIVAAYIFTIEGRKKYGNFMYNDGPASAIYSVLTKADMEIAKKGVIYAYCWMDINNKKAIRYNTRIGHQKPDGLYDIIYRKEIAK